MSGYRVFALIFNRLAYLSFRLLAIFSFVCTIFAPFAKRKELPPIQSDLLKVSATKLAWKIRRKEVKSVAVVEAYINRIQDVNPVLNAVVQHRFTEALDEARRADLLIEAAENAEDFAVTKPLLGIPITVKETIAVTGVSNNAARSRVTAHVAENDAECVQLLRKCGAIPLLVSNTPELCLYFETFNPAHGRTNNPYDSRRTCAGSSGGEGALLGAGASLMGVGSDIAGSIRIPAMFCGIFGHKPTPGFVPNGGHIPTSKDPMWDYHFTLGPLTRYAEDLSLILRCMIPERNHGEKLMLERNVDVSKIKIYYMYGEGKNSMLQDEPNFQVKKAVKTAVDIMGTNFQCKTTRVELSCFRNSVAFAMLILRMKGIENVFQTDDDNPDDYSISRMMKLLFEKLTFQSDASLSALLVGPMQYSIKIAPDVMKENLEKRLEYTKLKVLELLGNDGVLIYPTFPTEAAYHGRMLGQVLNISYTSLFNVLGVPVTQCHVGYTREGLPVGVQIVAAPEKDRLSIAVADAIATVTGGWRAPDEVKLDK